MADIKTINAVPVAGIKTYDSIPLANVKTINALTMGAGVTGPFEPDDIAGLQAWYKADAGVYSQSAAQFTAANAESLTIPSNSSIVLSGTSWTMGGWVNFDALGLLLFFDKRGATDGTEEYQLFVNGATLNGYYVSTGGGALIGGGTVTTGTWYFVVFELDLVAATASVYINNTLGTAAAGALASVGGVNPLTLGSDPAGRHSSCKMQNWFIFGRALNSTERSFLYNSGNGRSYEELDAVFKTDLRAWWPLDEADGTRRDKTANANHLTDNNTVTTAVGQVLNPPSSNALIYKWTDFSGNNRHMLQSALVNRPRYLLNNKNGLPVVQFRGQQYGGVTHVRESSIKPAVGSAFSAAVFDTGIGTISDGFAGLYGGEGEAGGDIVWTGIGNWYTGAPYAKWTDHHTDGVATISYSTDVWHDFMTLGTPVAMSGGVAGSDRGTAGRGWDGRAAEIVLYDTTLSAGNQTLVRGYLRTKWGLGGPDDIPGLQAWYKADQGVYSQSAAQFTIANSEYLSRASNTSLQLGNIDYTIGGWLYVDAVVGSAQVMIAKRGTDGAEYVIFIGDGSTIQMLVGGGIGNSGLVPGSGAWHLFVMSYNATTHQLSTYMDGAAGAVGDLTASPPTVVPTADLSLGAQLLPTATSFWGGRLQNWFIFGRALNATERSFLYNSGNGRSYEELDSAFKTDLRAWWPLDENDGTRKDKHTFANHLTDNNTVTIADGKVFNPASNNSRISRWNDQSGNGRHLGRIASTPLADTPLYLTAARNGLPVLQAYGPSIGALERLHWEGSMTAGSAFTALEWQGGLPVPGVYYGYLTVSGLYGILWVPYPGQSNWFTASSVFPPTNYYLDGAATIAMANGWHGYTTLGTPVTNSNLVLFEDRYYGRTWHGKSGEIIIYDTQLSPANQALIEQYLRAKWGLP